MLSIYWIKHIAEKQTLRKREKIAIDFFNLTPLVSFEALQKVYLVNYEKYLEFYNDLYQCLEREFFCPKLLNENLPIELKKDILILYAEKFIEFVLKVKERNCISIKAYQIKGRCSIRCKTIEGKFVSLTLLKTNSINDPKRNFILGAYKIATDLQNSLLLSDLESFKKWTKYLFISMT
jgi:hypothetical protein